MRDPYILICRAAQKCRGVRLTEEEVIRLAQDEAIQLAAMTSLEQCACFIGHQDECAFCKAKGGKDD